MLHPTYMYVATALSVCSVILKMTYGYETQHEAGDPLISLADRTLLYFVKTVTPLTWAVDFIPQLSHLPKDFPGFSFHETARVAKKLVEGHAEIPYSFVRSRTADESHRPSYVSWLIEKLSGESGVSPDDERVIKWSAATMYAAIADTTTLAVRSVILALVVFPEVQRKAQEEIDRVVGSRRLPDFKDRENLPYIEAMIKESVRWIPAAPVSMPRVATEDLTYGDYLISKGTVLYPSVWWFLHDPETYTDPECFKPERYLEPLNEPEPRYAFGFGRRACPGKFLTGDMLFILISRMVAVFEFSKAVDDKGIEIEVQVKIDPGMITRLKDFAYRVKPRSVERGELVKSLCAKQDKEESDGMSIEKSVREAMECQ
ncbi:hypothetical protein CDD80_6845 [Ophiocordyceps camponoti-rufipedis]|uniref:Cytochrome P450 n=1 Tax=Ophiocordyceps camponoti-rufipedis TaxID=2004952 RepID=A0A2C5YK32_9HYPO|nr:hypothetical protein CDD80_6845 [Ophiocordyceps camponoti-rufipedis]